MTAFDRVKKLCDRQGISVNNLEERIGLGKNSLYSWKNNVPGGVNLEKVADYFDVSTDYLLGREEKPKYTETDLSVMIDNALSFDGEPVTDHDREIIMAFLKGKYGVK